MTIKQLLKSHKKKLGSKPKAGKKRPAVRRSSYTENGITYNTTGVRVKVIAD